MMGLNEARRFLMSIIRDGTHRHRGRYFSEKNELGFVWRHHIHSIRSLILTNGNNRRSKTHETKYYSFLLSKKDDRFRKQFWSPFLGKIIIYWWSVSEIVINLVFLWSDINNKLLLLNQNNIEILIDSKGTGS